MAYCIYGLVIQSITATIRADNREPSCFFIAVYFTICRIAPENFCDIQQLLTATWYKFWLIKTKKKMKVLVTGGTGFIGSFVVEAFLN